MKGTVLSQFEYECKTRGTKEFDISVSVCCGDLIRLIYHTLFTFSISGKSSMMNAGMMSKFIDYPGWVEHIGMLWINPKKSA